MSLLFKKSMLHWVWALLSTMQWTWILRPELLWRINIFFLIIYININERYFYINSSKDWKSLFTVWNHWVTPKIMDLLDEFARWWYNEYQKDVNSFNDSSKV
jgi:hypothetical protein